MNININFGYVLIIDTCKSLSKLLFLPHENDYEHMCMKKQKL